MNGAPPDWQDGECCFRCRLQFSLVARKHHCRNCGNIFCAKCSSQSIPLPSLNIEKAVRVCDGCYEKLTGKVADPLSSTTDSMGPDTKTASKSETRTTSSSKSSKSNSKPAANASAPSEQELREEEELQLALALSLSEAPAKISFPDCRQLEDGPSGAASTSTSTTPPVKSNQAERPVINNVASSHQPTVQPASQNVEPPQQYFAAIEKQQPPSQVHTLHSQDVPVQDGDHELFRFVAEVQSTAEVFTNRINSNKARNRPVKDDPAIQSLFLKLTDMHAKLLDYIKVHDGERATLETLQDKLSQISDARAALDALREEHQEKVRQEAAEAERQRQSQLALKLEMMRQKKSQMMQYQREVALQRIQAQEMMLRQQQTGYQSNSNGVPQAASNSQVSGLSQQHNESQATEQHHIEQAAVPQAPVQLPQHQIQHAPMVQQQQPVYQPPYSQSGQQYATQSTLSAPAQPQHQLNQAIQQQFQPPVPKQEEEALLISFDD